MKPPSPGNKNNRVTDFPTRSRLPQGSETILVVDDEPAVKAFVAEILRNCGYTVLEAADGLEAISALKKHEGDVDLLLSDMVMKPMNGRRTAEEIRALQSGVKILFMSGHTDDTFVRQILQDGESSFLAKPFTPNALAAKVRGVLDS